MLLVGCLRLMKELRAAELVVSPFGFSFSFVHTSFLCRFFVPCNLFLPFLLKRFPLKLRVKVVTLFFIFDGGASFFFRGKRERESGHSIKNLSVCCTIVVVNTRKACLFAVVVCCLLKSVGRKKCFRRRRTTPVDLKKRGFRCCCFHFSVCKCVSTDIRTIGDAMGRDSRMLGFDFLPFSLLLFFSVVKRFANSLKLSLLLLLENKRFLARRLCCQQRCYHYQ